MPQSPLKNDALSADLASDATKRERATTVAGEPFGPYFVYERLGVGGMATVHRAFERTSDGVARDVALKRLLPHLAEDETFVRSFVREAKLASMLQHPHIVQLYELGRVGHVYFISMEYIEGRDLRRLLRQARRVAGPPPMSVVLAIMLQLLDALQYAHTRRDDEGQPLGLVHRDVSPSNVLLTPEGSVKVIDFGIAKAQAQQFRTQTGRVKGKLAYMAPEAVSGRSTDARADLFSAGVIAHELITARPLFASKNEYQTLLKLQREDILPPSRHNLQCPRELDAVVLKALERDPDQRFATAAAFRAALVAVQRRFGMAATAAEVKQWCEMAFALPDPSSGQPGAVDVAGPTQTWRKSRGEISNPPSSSGASQGAAKISTSDDEDVAEEAWGNREQTSGIPVVLEDVPDVSEKVDATIIDLRPGAIARGKGRRMRSTSSFVWASGSSDDAIDQALFPSAGPPQVMLGASVVGQAPRRWPYFIVFLVAVGALGYGAVRWTQAERPTVVLMQPTPAPDVAPSKLRITVVPATATIAIEGLASHQGSPYSTELPPGEYNLTISKEGFQPAVLNLSIEPRETLTIHHVLEKAGERQLASVVLKFDSKYTARLDEMDWQSTSPLQRELEPGPHELVLKEQGETVWRKNFVAKASATYVFEPTAAELRRRTSAGLSGVAAVASSAAVAVSAARTASSAPFVTPTADDAPAGAVADETPSPKPETSPLAKGTEEPSFAATSQPPPMLSVASAGPRVVPPGSVTRVSGTTPTLRKAVGMPPFISVKLCIDTVGNVTSVSVLGDVPARARKDLEKSLSGWHYRAYRDQGRAVPVCFVASFAVE